MPSPLVDLRIAPMGVAELGTALDWAAAEGWNPGLDDASAFLAADPRGFLMGWVGDDAVACISVVRHSPAFGFLGLYLCRPAWRGQGYGWALWQAGLAHLGDRTVGLDGVLAQQANYRRSGFAGTGRTVRHLGTPAPAPAGDLAAASGHLPALAALDRRATGIDRPAFLAAWLADTATRRTLALVEQRRGPGVRHRPRLPRGPQDRPADRPRPVRRPAARRRARRALPRSPPRHRRPRINPAAVALAAGLGLAPVFETARMYRGPAPGERPDLIWGVATLELG